jgi:hypothetical protein
MRSARILPRVARNVSAGFGTDAWFPRGESIAPWRRSMRKYHYVIFASMRTSCSCTITFGRDVIIARRKGSQTSDIRSYG